MKELTNADTYNFISKELTCHPELTQYSPEELKSHENDKKFWEKLWEDVDGFSICDHCGKPMLEGYSMDGTHYCSKNCVLEDYTKEELKELCGVANSEYYYTNWYEDSITYNK